MRSTRMIAATLFSLLVAAPSVHAQDSGGGARFFQDSWFWGVHAGATSIGTPARSTTTAGTIGGDWLITRTTGGLYVAYDQANFNTTSSVPDAGTTTGAQPVSVHDLRTVSLAAMAFPFHARNFRPYAGLGFGLSVVGSASPQVSAAGDSISAISRSRADDARSRVGVLVLGGVQWQVRRTAIFGQFTTMPGSSDFLVTKPVMTFMGGVRYNFGSSIER